MAGTHGSTEEYRQSWFGTLCGWLLKLFGFFLVAGFFSLLVNVFSNIASQVLPKNWVDILKKPVEWAVQHPGYMVLIGIIFLLLMWVFYLGSRHHPTVVSGSPGTTSPDQGSTPASTTSNTPSPSPQSAPQAATNKETEQRYLSRMIQDTYMVGLEGIPTGLEFIAERVPLDQVFIPLRFHPNRLRVEYPLSDEDIRNYREAQKEGRLSEYLERVLFEAEKSWVYPRNPDTISIAALWQSLTTRMPAAVIQGYPGMGKSTLMTRITLHMARACLGEADPTMPDPLTPPRIPILLSLGRYARERRNISYLSLLDYLKAVAGKLGIPDLDSFLVKCLGDGRCLVMLDGLDEASVDDPGIREQVQKEIKAFIQKLPGNRFLITSRVAGYDQAAFPDYTHYLVANLSPKQIEDFLPRWCRANVLKRRGLTNTLSDAQEESVAAEAAKLTQDLRAAIRDNQGVQQLAENPLLLTLLAVMQQNSIQLPQRRVELYDVVTRTLLEHRNRLSELPWIPEVQAVALSWPACLSHARDRK